MAALDFARTTPFATRFVQAVVDGPYAALKSWNDARVTRASLARLTDRELADIGMSRGDIDVVAVRGTRF